MYLSEHFSLVEAYESNTAERYDIDNTPPESLWPVLIHTALRMEAVRSLLNAPIHVSSWYRCLELNRLLKSKDTSQHVKGEAVDFTAPGFGTPVEIAKKLKANRFVLEFDQVILEHSWIHISFLSIPSVEPRLQVLSLLHDKSYAVGITNKYGVPL